MSSMWLSCPMSNRGGPVQCLTRGVRCPTGLSCSLSNRGCHVQQKLSCPLSNRGCHVHFPTGAVMSKVQQGCHVHRGCHVHCPPNRGCHVQCPTGAVMSNVKQELSCPLSNRGCHVHCRTWMLCPLSIMWWSFPNSNNVVYSGIYQLVSPASCVLLHHLSDLCSFSFIWFIHIWSSKFSSAG